MRGIKVTNLSRLYIEMFKGNQVFGIFDQVGSLVLPREEKAAGTPWRPWLWLSSLVRAAACVQTRQGGQTPPDTCITALTAVHCIDELKCRHSLIPNALFYTIFRDTSTLLIKPRILCVEVRPW